MPPDVSFNREVGESFRIFSRNALQDLPIASSDLSSQFEWLNEGMRLEDIELESRINLLQIFTY